MNTPIADFVRAYASSGTARMHMPGHKGSPILGCEALDITEIQGADALYEARGIIAESEANASALFRSGKTLYSTEGSSQCIRAMVYLAVTCRRKEASPLILAARNAHKSFLYALALTGADVCWMFGGEERTVCSCRITPGELRKELERLSREKTLPAAVYITSPDYLGTQADLPGLAEVCRACGVPLLVDHAHGAYLSFSDPPQDPLTAGADICCQSAHKTLPVLTGGAYLHLAKNAPPSFFDNARAAMELFGSTSPSYLILQSLDLCNRLLADRDWKEKLKETADRMEKLRTGLRSEGWEVLRTDPMRLTIRCDGYAAAARLRKAGIEPEYAERDYLVMMVTPFNEEENLIRTARALGRNDLQCEEAVPALWKDKPVAVCSPRKALFSRQERVPAEVAEGRVCGSPSISCPPAVPIAVAGEMIGRQEIELFKRYNIQDVYVLKQF